MKIKARRNTFDTFDFRDEYEIHIDGELMFRVFEDEPEDMILSRTLSDCLSIPKLLEMAYLAGKNGETFELNGEVLHGVSEEVVEVDKPPFPMVIRGWLMNILAEEDEVDEKLVSKIWEKWEEDISLLLGWDIETEFEGTNYHDGQVLEYTVTLTSPEGHKYKAFDEHCGMIGWDFEGNEEVDFE